MSTLTELTLDQRIAQRIRIALRTSRVSQSELAVRLDVSATWLSYRMTGHYSFTVAELERVATALGVSYQDLAVPQLPTDRKEVQP